MKENNLDTKLKLLNIFISVFESNDQILQSNLPEWMIE